MKLRSLNSTTTLDFYILDYTTELELPFVYKGVSAGFPSLPDDFIELTINPNKFLVRHKDTTFFP